MVTMRALGRVLLVGLMTALLVPAASTALDAGPRCVIDGTPGPDVLQGTSDGDGICGRAGRDKIRGAAGNDVIYAGRGRDGVRAGNGDDRAYGGCGADALIGSGGFDYLSGGPSKDFLRGGNGKDCLYAIDGGPSDAGWGGNDRDYGDFDPGDRIHVERKNQGVLPSWERGVAPPVLSQRFPHRTRCLPDRAQVSTLPLSRS
jgi:hemolysin type calcium-binding protein